MSTAILVGLLCGALVAWLVQGNPDDHSHNHTTLASTQRGSSYPVKEQANELFSMGTRTPRSIILYDIRKGLPEAPKMLLKNYSARHKVLLGESSVSVGDLAAWCASRQVIWNDLGWPFVVAKELILEAGAEPDIRILLSTRRLLRQATRSRIFQIDSTCRLNALGLAVSSAPLAS